MARWLSDAFGIALNQRDVDFVIPRLDADLPLCIDPFLLYKSRRSDMRGAHDLLLQLFNEAFGALRVGEIDQAQALLDFPEVHEIRFGYSRTSMAGTGLGYVLGEALIETLRESPALIERGLRHVEELQLFSPGIAEDRISDLAANVIKHFLISYTQAQCNLWDIPMAEIPIHHVWDADERSWRDFYAPLPRDPLSGFGILLVPRWIVRRLPWINFDDFVRTDLRVFLRSRLPGDTARARLSKERVVRITREHVSLVDQYVERKEREAPFAQPEPPPLLASALFPAGDDILTGILGTPIGQSHAYAYQRAVFRLFNTLFEPELVDGQEQVRTVSGVEIRDITYSNNSDMPFLRYLMTNCGNLVVTFECKNVNELTPDDINQLANYLGDPLGYCGFLVTRREPSQRILAKAQATYNKQHPRKTIIALHDDDLRIMVDMKRIGTRHPVEHLQRKFRVFVQSLE